MEHIRAVYGTIASVIMHNSIAYVQVMHVYVDISRYLFLLS